MQPRGNSQAPQYGTHTDIQDLKLASRALRDSETSYRVVLQTATDSIINIDTRGQIVFCNEATTRLFGYSNAELIGHPLTMLMPEAYRKLHQAGVERYLQTGERHLKWAGTELVALKKSGEEFPVEVSFGEILKDGEHGFTGFIRDISVRKRAEKALQESESRWRAIFENSAIGIALTDLEGRFLAVNSAYREMVGYSESELRGLSFLDLMVQQHHKDNVVLVSDLLEGRRQQFRLEKEYRRKDGSSMWVRVHASVILRGDAKPQYLLGIVEDISKRKQFEQQLQHERDCLQVLLDLNNTLVSRLDLRHLFQGISSGLRRAMGCDCANLKLPDAETGLLRLHVLDHPDSKGFLREDMSVPLEGSASGRAFQTKQAVVIDRVEDVKRDPDIFGNPEGESFYQALQAEGIRSACNLPLMRGERVLGVLTLASRRERAFTGEDVAFLTQIAGQIAIAVENALNYDEVAKTRDRLAEERQYLAEEIRTEHNFEQIIGESAALKHALRQVETVAPTDSSVLILGETGTGKELIARAIHNLSPRRDRTFVKVNCAAIPLGLLESELFGHEKGAFTGAICQKIGRFELAHQGTLFLDEVGDIPMELQPKLLRVLQEQEFERLGSTRTIRVDVRMVTATSRDLPQMIEEQRFRSDLYYRLNVFPIGVPPLRERAEDIAMLVKHFADKFGRRMNKRIREIPDDVMQALMRHRWAGNVRELQNFVERAVILTPGTVLRAPLSELKRAVRESRAAPVTLEEAERDHILKVLEGCNWVLSGSKGAASRLGLKRTTLSYKMQKLGITNPRR